MKEDWLDKLQTRIQKECDVKAPDGLLDDIKQEMNRRGLAPVRSPRQKASIAALWTYRAAAAAAVIGFGLYLSHLLLNHTPLPKHCATITDRRTSTSPASPTTNITPENSVTDNAAKTLQLAVVTRQSTQEPPAGSSLTASTTANRTEETTTDSQNVTETPETTHSTRQEKPKETGRQQTTKPQSWGTTERNYTPDVKNNQTSRLSIGTSYHYGTGTSSNPDKILLAVANPYGDYDPAFSGRNVQDYSIGTKDTRTGTKHHQPVKFGVSVRYNLNSRWSLQTGLTYSRLTSDFSYNKMGTAYVVEQKLQYVGLPVNASYSFIKTKRFNVYATAGAEIEKLVKGEANLPAEATPQAAPTHRTIKEGRPVFSTVLSIGGEIRFNKDVSAYIEPGVSRHFNNGSDIENIYKDKPTSFNLNMGIRFNINK